MRRFDPLIALSVSLTLLTVPAQAGLFDQLKETAGSVLKSTTGSTSSTSTLSNTEIIDGLKQALQIGSQKAIEQLGQHGGYLAHPDVRIPIPDTLQPVAKSLDYLGQGALVEQFQTTLNRAAEQAVPEAVEIFSDAIRQMSIEDAKQILDGPDDAATSYFRKTSGEKLYQRFLPIVQQATNAAGVTASYKQLAQQAKSMSNLIPQQALNLDGFVTQKAVDGLFLRIAQEEKSIRENPAERTTELLKKVFTQ